MDTTTNTTTFLDQGTPGVNSGSDIPAVIDPKGHFRNEYDILYRQTLDLYDHLDLFDLGFRIYEV